MRSVASSVASVLSIVVMRGDDIRRVTQIFNDRLGEAIREYPEQYLWSHRRWRED